MDVFGKSDLVAYADRKPQFHVNLESDFDAQCESDGDTIGHGD